MLCMLWLKLEGIREPKSINLLIVLGFEECASAVGKIAGEYSFGRLLKAGQTARLKLARLRAIRDSGFTRC